MSYAPRPTSTFSSHVRASSSLAGGGNISTQQTSNLQARINEKRLELESLKQLRDLSGGLAGQMQQLEEKLATLSTGTEAVAAVMGNWATVLRAIHMASAKIPRPKDPEAENATDAENERELPQTLVRIPIQQAEAAQQEEQRREATGGD